MGLDTNHLSRCIATLESSLTHLKAAKRGGVDYEVFRNASIKGFELTLETTGKLLRKVIKLYSGNPRAVDQLTYKEILRHAAKHGLLDTATVVRWFQYRDNRNNTAHDYGEAFAEETLSLLPGFVNDARALQKTLQEKLGPGHAS